MSRGLAIAVLSLPLLAVAPGDAQQRPISSVNPHELKFQVVDTSKALSTVNTSKYFSKSKQSSPFSLNKFFPKFSLPLFSSKPAPAQIAKPGQNPLLPTNGPVIFNPKK